MPWVVAGRCLSASGEFLFALPQLTRWGGLACAAGCGIVVVAVDFVLVLGYLHQHEHCAGKEFGESLPSRWGHLVASVTDKRMLPSDHQRDKVTVHLGHSWLVAHNGTDDETLPLVPGTGLAP